MKPSKLYEALHALIGERVPLHIWGPCGVGKSQIVGQVADVLSGTGRHAGAGGYELCDRQCRQCVVCVAPKQVAERSEGRGREQLSLTGRTP